ncbi:jg11748 [Pararge aegeria aegeria]|uniref:Jg11748 protein n=1 Tax=Pararge aegeria aegeria TaxID=348720 RepID=A0A8S4S4D7_9NEOP|nr:jg11748 [Pararge aegeria aegeria]
MPAKGNLGIYNFSKKDVPLPVALRCRVETDWGYYKLARYHLKQHDPSETLRPWGPGARALFKELSKRVIESTGDPRAGSYLGQRISLAIQRGNAASILGTVPCCVVFEDVLDFI